MEEKIAGNLEKEKLKICINKLRDVLNEICCTIDESEVSKERLIVSRHLDKLIIEYMDLKK